MKAWAARGTAFFLTALLWSLSFINGGLFDATHVFLKPQLGALCSSQIIMGHPHLMEENNRCTWKPKQGELRQVPGGQEVLRDGCREYSELIAAALVAPAPRRLLKARKQK